MKNHLDHLAINVKDLSWYTNFFQSVFNMTISKTNGQFPNRKVWFKEGIQLNEQTNDEIFGNKLDHLAIKVENIDEIINIALKTDCTLLNKKNWIKLPNAIVIELIS